MANLSKNALLPAHEDFKSNSLRGAPDYFRVGQTRSGQWWLVDPHGRGFFAKAVAGVNHLGRSSLSSQPGQYAERTQALYGEEPGNFARSAIQRLRGWNFTTLGAWSGAELFEQGMYYTVALELGKIGPAIHAGDALLPDVFDPLWQQAVETRVASVCALLRNSRELIGYFTDHEPGWAQSAGDARAGRHDDGTTAPERPTLLQLCLSLEPSARAYHAAWEFVLAPRQGDLEALSRDWGVALPNKEVLRQLTQEEKPLRSDGYARDQQRFTREFARRYFSIGASAIRMHDPHHLILGCRFGRHPGGAVLAECVYPNVDVVSANPGGESLEKAAQSYFSANGMPVWLTGVNWARDVFLRTPDRRDVRGLTRVERMLRKGRAALERLCALRCAVGYEWSHWADEEGELAPFGSGLVRIDDREAYEHTELLTDLNARVEKLRRKV